MSATKRPSTSSLRRFITSRPYVPVAEIRRRFGIDDPDCMCFLERDGQAAFVGLPEREASKIQDLWSREEIGLELSVEVHAPVVVGIYPMRIARYFMEGDGNGYHPNGHHPAAFTETHPPRQSDPTPTGDPGDPVPAAFPGSPASAH